MLFVLAVGGLLSIAAAFAAWPLLRRPQPAIDADRRGINVNLYRQRVAEIEADRDAGSLSASDAQSLMQELAATLLDDAHGNEPDAARGDRAGWLAAGVVVSIVVVSLLLYQRLGAYDAVQLAQSAAVLRAADAEPAALSDLVVQLRARVATQPDDAESWYLLGHTLLRQDDAAGAVVAFEKLSTLAGSDPSVQVALAQARFVAANGTITDVNRQLIERILAQDPQQSVVLEMLALEAFRRADYTNAARYLESALAGGAAGARAEALQQGLERARALLGDAGPAIEVTIEIGGALESLPASAALFVYARMPGQRMPLLVARRPVDGASMKVRLDRTNAMQGDVTLREGETLDVAARLSLSGDLSTGADDLQVSQNAVTLHGSVTQVALALGPPNAAVPVLAQSGGGVTAGAPQGVPTSAAATVELSVAFAPGVEAPPPARVFVIARAPGGPPMPIAVRALDPATLPQTLVLTDADAMQPNRMLSMFERIEVVARLSRSGNPVRQLGDVESKSQLVDPHATQSIALIIGG